MNSASVDLLAGTNTIKLTANSVRGPNIDYMELVQIPPAVV
ncbi:MAG: hypothetical protein QNJ54_32755 [Prochloraceae cyanobacterium]|nr:hypothetical protein [Prochloraceae cyanobacterium]